ncbi:MAG: PH domain-containing protein [Candidatus Marinimicrobia bacterium]|nr:PH domain-containing protein [Candidatus Neomarinimicrobiota bacterium]MCF7903556.1 PH domain-containing protein [Candidatus Neomarinimicrobiota bacterium]
MEIKPNVSLLLKKEIYTLLTISLVVILGFLIIHLLVVGLDPDVSNDQFIRNMWPWPLYSLLVIWILTPGLRYLWFINLNYSVESERLMIQKGILTKKKVSIPYSAVTDFTLNRSLYDRWIGIGSLFVQTAGQGPQSAIHEGRLDGLVEFDSLHQELRARVKASRSDQQSEQSGDLEPVADTEVLNSILEEIKKINRKLN